jgi:hypothetical protein
MAQASKSSPSGPRDQSRGSWSRMLTCRQLHIRQCEWMTACVDVRGAS